MRASKLTTGVLGILFIGTMTAGCGESRKQTIAKCAVETQRLYRDYSFLHDHPNSFMRRCMGAAGYEYTCSNAFGVESDRCYRTELEAWWQRNFK
jgi:hypothetical protein